MTVFAWILWGFLNLMFFLGMCLMIIGFIAHSNGEDFEISSIRIDTLLFDIAVYVFLTIYLFM